ncbi:MAG: hypothetical protein QNJ69_01800 [Gammaproteobacteria bacterium]|nr:hypothetical protein [Gammaproteobacteria bacterium]
MRLPLFCLLLLMASPGHAAQLFGISLQDATRDQLRSAVKNSGVELIREGGDQAFFDIYDSKNLLPGSVHLYLGFVKQDQSFAFAEYAFNGLRQPQLLQRLSAKYGQPQLKQGKYLSDQSHVWQSGQISISLSYDWQNYQTRLTYSRPDKLELLRQEQAEYRRQLALQGDDFLEQAY